MSYILDALRKSDQQRRRNAAPTLLTLQPSAVVRKRPAYLAYGLAAAILVGGGVVIGWLRPWQSEQAAPRGPEPVAVKPIEARPIETNPIEAKPGQAASTASGIAPPATPVPKPDGLPPEAKAPDSAGAAAPPERRVDIAAADAAGETVISMESLPLSIQQELPKIAISVHAYSKTPARRLVGIGNRILHEGDYLAPGLKLEEITADGMILGYKGYRFRRGVK